MKSFTDLFYKYKDNWLKVESKRADASYNTKFTLRAIRPSVLQELEESSEKYLAIGVKRNQPDTSTPTKRIAPDDIVALGRREHNNIRRNRLMKN
jgi:hypothetical protein